MAQDEVKAKKCQRRGHHTYRREQLKVGNLIHTFRKCTHCGISFEVPQKDI